jgi:hypothetical protein
MTTYEITRDGETEQFDSKGEFEEMKDLLDSNGVEYDTNVSDDTKTDGGEVVETAQPVEVADDTDTADLPDRELTDDPIDWLAQGSDEFVTEIKGTPVITKKGFRVLQHRYDISTTSEIVVGPEETGHEFCRVKATAEMPDGRSAEAHASAHVERGDDHFLLTSMADTRAKSRALSDVTGVGAIAVSEYVDDFEKQGDTDA